MLCVCAARSEYFEFHQEMLADYQAVHEIIHDKTDAEINAELLSQVSQTTRRHDTIQRGLLFGVLTRPEVAEQVIPVLVIILNSLLTRHRQVVPLSVLLGEGQFRAGHQAAEIRLRRNVSESAGAGEESGTHREYVCIGHFYTALLV